MFSQYEIDKAYKKYGMLIKGDEYLNLKVKLGKRDYKLTLKENSYVNLLNMSNIEALDEFRDYRFYRELLYLVKTMEAVTDNVMLVFHREIDNELPKDIVATYWENVIKEIGNLVRFIDSRRILEVYYGVWNLAAVYYRLEDFISECNTREDWTQAPSSPIVEDKDLVVQLTRGDFLLGSSKLDWGMEDGELIGRLWASGVRYPMSFKVRKEEDRKTEDLSDKFLELEWTV